MTRTALLFALALAGPAAAFDIGYEHWDYDVEGFVDNAGDVLDFRRDLTVEARNETAFALRWDTAPGWLPDFAAQYLRVDAGGRRVVSEPMRFGEVTLVPGSIVLADADLDDYALTLRYPWRGARATLWGGLTVKHIGGDVTVRDESDQQETIQPIDETFPMLHARAELGLGGRLTASLQGNWVAWDDDEADEALAELALQVWRGLGVSAGWQRRHYRIEADRYRFDATLDGAIFGVRVGF